MATLIKYGKWKMENGEWVKHKNGWFLPLPYPFSIFHSPFSAFSRIAVFAFVLSIFHFPLSTFLSSAEGATYYLDYENGSDGNNGSSWAQAKKTINGYTAGIIAPGDTIRIAKSSDPTSLGINATWTNLSKTVTLASALNATVDLCESAWTASTNVTCTTSSTRKQGSLSASHAIASGFTTGKAAYKTISSTNYSGYQQISFWIQVNAQVNSGVLRIDLCSDTAGATPVDSFTINTTLYANQYYPLTINKGSGLGSAIQSVALYCISDPGTVTVLLDDIITVKAAANADALSLTSLIGKNTAGESWYGIKSISTTTVILDNEVNDSATGGRGYSGTTATVTTYKRETIKTTPVSSSTTAVQTVQDSGSSGSLITFSGGWDTGTTTQNGETWFDGQNGFGYGIYATSKSYFMLEKLGLVRYNYNVYFTSSNNATLSSVTLNNATSYGFYTSGGNTHTLTTVTANNVGATGLYLSGIAYSHTLTSCTANNADNYGVYMGSIYNSTFDTLTTNNCANAGLNVATSSANTFYALTAKDAPSSSFSGLYFSLGGKNTFVNATLSNPLAPTDIRNDDYGDNYFFNSSSLNFTGPFAQPKGSYCYVHRNGQTAGRFKVFQSSTSGGTLAGVISDQITGGQAAGWARGGSGICLYLNPGRTIAGEELTWEFWMPVTASASTTLSFYHKITTSFNGSLKVTVYDSDDNNTKLINAASVTFTDNGAWNQYTSASFTPTDTGFCRIVLEALDGATTGDIGIDDVSVSPDPNVNYGGMDRWWKGEPVPWVTDTRNEHSYGWIE